jgi:CheY-like chemotaxis protein
MPLSGCSGRRLLPQVGFTENLPPTMRKAEILVLDDDAAVASILSEMLDLLGHAPTSCHDPAQALTLLETRSFDLILSDFHMPGMEGNEFYRRLRDARPELARRVVFLTGDVLNEDTQFFVRSTGNPHLLKPFQFAKVREVVAQALGALQATMPPAAASPPLTPASGPASG